MSLGWHNVQRGLIRQFEGQYSALNLFPASSCNVRKEYPYEVFFRSPLSPAKDQNQIQIAASHHHEVTIMLNQRIPRATQDPRQKNAVKPVLQDFTAFRSFRRSG